MAPTTPNIRFGENITQGKKYNNKLQRRERQHYEQLNDRFRLEEMSYLFFIISQPKSTLFSLSQSFAYSSLELFLGEIQEYNPDIDLQICFLVDSWSFFMLHRGPLHFEIKTI